MLGEELIKRHLLTQEKLDICLRVQRATSEKLGEIATRLGFVAESDVKIVLLETDSKALDNVHSYTDYKLPPDFLRRTKTIIQGDPGQKLYISTLHPDPAHVVKSLGEYTGKEVELVSTRVKDLLEKLYSRDEGAVDIPMALIEEEDVSKIITSILSLAVRDGASDVHLIPDGSALFVNIVVDGVPYNQAVFPISKADMIIAAIKVRSGMNVSETRVSQDGGYAFVYKAKSIDLRVSTLLLDGGEKITIRLLDKENVFKSISSLGISAVDEFMESATQSSGIVLVCGSTGSGKSTTLYSTVLSYDRIHETINTIEDPIEYRLPGIQQSQVNPRLDPPFTYASFTRTVLRHAPRKIVIGEIRDEETAKNAFTLAETGHFVLSTLHTTDVLTTIQRLEGLGVDKTLLPLLLKGILVQRLVRKICTDCNGVGCTHCRDGYSGRTLLTEFARFRKAEDVDAALNGTLKYHTFADDAVLKIGSGVTDCYEISRVSENHVLLCNGGNCVSSIRKKCALRQGAVRNAK